MAELEELVSRLALRIRHTAAVAILESLPGADERMSLLADIVAPRPALEQASRTAARQELERRETGLVDTVLTR